MDEGTASWIAIGHTEDIPIRGARCVKNGDVQIAVFRTDDDHFYAIEDRCPHRGGPLSQGIVHDGCVTCPLHNWVISLESGEAQGADQGEVKTYPVKVDGNTLSISIPESTHA